MNNNEEKSKELVTISKAGLMALVARQLKGTSLFPKQVEEAKKIMARAMLVKEIEN